MQTRLKLFSILAASILGLCAVILAWGEYDRWRLINSLDPEAREILRKLHEELAQPKGEPKR